MKGSDLFVKALENEGVDRIFAVPGEENLDVVESLRTSSIEPVLVRHEQSAAFMAATHDLPAGMRGTGGPYGRGRGPDARGHHVAGRQASRTTCAEVFRLSFANASFVGGGSGTNLTALRGIDKATRESITF